MFFKIVAAWGGSDLTGSDRDFNLTLWVSKQLPPLTVHGGAKDMPMRGGFVVIKREVSVSKQGQSSPTSANNRLYQDTGGFKSMSKEMPNYLFWFAIN